jgi:putative selenium metabolism hydrolase
MAALVQAGALIKQLDLAGDTTVWMVGSVREEDCDGLCWHYILSEGVIRPEAVVITEPTDLSVYRGQRGRMEIQVTTRGISCHGSAPERGVNAVYRMAPLVEEISRLGSRLPSDPFLGPGSITVSDIRSTAPSLCAVADSCALYLDRRLTAGETDATALSEIESIARAAEAKESDEVGRAGPAEIAVPEFREPSYTGLVYPMRKVYPSWLLPEEHPLVQMGLEARAQVLGERGRPGKWVFSTNGVATMGLHGVPTIGFGPANEVHAHAPSDQCPVGHLSPAVAFYAAITALFARGRS